MRWLALTFHVESRCRRVAVAAVLSTIGAANVYCQADSTALPRYMVRGNTIALAVPSTLSGATREWVITRARDGTARINRQPVAGELLVAPIRVSSVEYSSDSARIVITFTSYTPTVIRVARRDVPVLLPLLRSPSVADSVREEIAAARRAPPTPPASEAASRMPDPFVDVIPALASVSKDWTASPIDTVRFRALLWSKLPAARTDTAWNEKTTAMPLRIARTASGEVLQALRRVMPNAPKSVAGVRLALMIMRHDPTSPIKITLGDWTEWYIPTDAYRSLERADITLGQFYAKCFVLLDGTRVDVDLSAQGR
jgi:hypothetical protein